MPRMLHLEGGVSFQISEEKAAKSKLDSGIRLRNRRGTVALWNRQAAPGMWPVNAGSGTSVPSAVANLIFIQADGKLYGVNPAQSRIAAWEETPDEGVRTAVAALLDSKRLSRRASLAGTPVVLPHGRSIKVAASRVGNEFLHVADDYFHRPASDDFWRLEASDDENMTISRLVDDGDGPQVNEVERRATAAARIAFRAAPKEPDNYSFLALSPGDDLLLLDGAFNTYRLAEVIAKDPHNRFPDPALEKPLRVMATVQSKMMKDAIDERWASEWRAFTDFLATHGPIQLSASDPYFKSLMDLQSALGRAVND